MSGSDVRLFWTEAVESPCAILQSLSPPAEVAKESSLCWGCCCLTVEPLPVCVPERSCGAEAPPTQPLVDRDHKSDVRPLKLAMVYYCSIILPILTKQSQSRGPLYIICWLSLKDPIILFSASD